MLFAHAQEHFTLGRKGGSGVLLFPSSSGNFVTRPYWFLGCPRVFEILVLFATFRFVGPGFGDRLSLARNVRTLMMTHTTFARGVDSGKQLYPLQTLLRP